MNYFAHGIRFLDRPWFLAGTAIPDWLSVADRQVRMRERLVQPFFDDPDEVQAEVAAGIAQHLADDQWFHESRAFYEVTSDVADRFREHLGPEDGFRPGFLGHITTELLLDRLLIEAAPEKLDRYYEVLAELDALRIESAVNRMARRPTSRLAPFVDLFAQIQFLRDYLRADSMLTRLNQVLRRVRLNPLPDTTADVLEDAFHILRRRGRELLPAQQFGLP